MFVSCSGYLRLTNKDKIFPMCSWEMYGVIISGVLGTYCIDDYWGYWNCKVCSPTYFSTFSYWCIPGLITPCAQIWGTPAQAMDSPGGAKDMEAQCYNYFPEIMILKNAKLHIRFRDSRVHLHSCYETQDKYSCIYGLAGIWILWRCER